MAFLSPSDGPLVLVLALSLCMAATAQTEAEEGMIVLNDEIPPGQCCYNDACNNNILCAPPQSSLTDSCGLSYTVNSDCKLSQHECCFNDPCGEGTSTNCVSVGQHFMDTCAKPHRVTGKCAATTSSCCFEDGCDNSKDQCTIPGGFIVNSCPRTYNVSDLCEISAVQCCFPDCNGVERCAKLDIFNKGYGMSTLRRELFCEGFEQLVAKTRCDDITTSAEIVAEGARIDLERQASIEFPSAGVDFTVELLPLDPAVPAALLLNHSLQMEGVKASHKFRGNSGTTFQAPSRGNNFPETIKNMVSMMRKRLDWQQVFKQDDLQVKNIYKNGKKHVSFDLKFNDIFQQWSSANVF